MAKYSILMRVQSPDQARLQAAIASLTAQTYPDLELVLVGTAAELARLGTQPSWVRTVATAQPEPLAWTADSIPALGEWIGFLGQDDRLADEALAQVDALIQAQPQVRVVYTDEESCSPGGLVTLRSRKGGLNSLRLVTQEYLRDFVVIRRDTLEALDGFHRMASTCPTHDLFLRIWEQHGSAAFGYVPERLYLRYRDHRLPLGPVPRDQWAAQQHLLRRGFPAVVRELNGQLEVDYRFETHPWVTVVIVVEDDVAEGLHRIHRSQIGPLYRPATFKVLHLGSDPEARLEYQRYCSAFQLQYRWTVLPRIQALNQEAQQADTELVLFLQGAPVNPRWLHRLVDHARQANTGAVGARCWYQTRLHQPGILGHAYEGWDWNTAGRFELMTVPHHIAAVSPACLLVDTRRFLAQGGFSEAYPTLYGMDLCLKLGQAGYRNALVPMSQVEVPLTVIPVTERDAFTAAWAGWQDPYRLHQF